MACWLADDNIFQAGLTKTEGNNILSTCYNGHDGHEAKGQNWEGRYQRHAAMKHPGTVDFFLLYRGKWQKHGLSFFLRYRIYRKRFMTRWSMPPELFACIPIISNVYPDYKS
jgi:hypothetical protein